MRQFSLSLAIGLSILLFASKPAHALVIFDDLVNINLSNSGVVGVEDAPNIARLDFDGVIFSNGTNADGTQPIAGQDARVVGHGNHTDARQDSLFGPNISGGLTNSSVFGHTTSFEITTVVRDWNGTLESLVVNANGSITATILYGDFVRTDAGGTNVRPEGTGFVDLYLDTSENFSPLNVNTSADGVWLATFGIRSVSTTTQPEPSRSQFTFNPNLNVVNGSGITRVTLELVAAITDDFFTLTDDTALLGNPNLALATLIASTEEPAPFPGATGISGGTDPVNVGAGYNPATSTSLNEFPNDVFSTFDSANTFAQIIPEPSSIILALTSLAICGVAGLRRRRNSQSI